jgi:aspartate ammonia-lyase
LRQINGAPPRVSHKISRPKVDCAASNAASAFSFALFLSIRTMENAVNGLREHCIMGITAHEERTREMVLNSLGIVTLLKPVLGYKQCAREGYAQSKSLHQIVVQERKLLTQQKWDEIFSFENLINPEFIK